MFPITITIHNAEQLGAVLAVLGHDPMAPTGQHTLVTTATKPAKEAAAPAPLPTSAATPASPAPTSPTAEADVETAAPAKTVAESSPTAAPAVAEPQASTAATAATEAAQVPYPVLQKAVFALAAKSKSAALETAASFGVKTFKELKPEQFGAALDAVEAKLRELSEV